MRWVASVATDCADLAELAASYAARAASEAEHATSEGNDERAELAKKHAIEAEARAKRYLLIAKSAEYATHIYA